MKFIFAVLFFLICAFDAKAETIRCTYAEYEWIVRPDKQIQSDFDLSRLSLIEEMTVELDVKKNKAAKASIILSTGTRVNFTILITNKTTTISTEKNGFTHTAISHIDDLFPGGPNWTSSSDSNVVTKTVCELVAAN